MHNRQKIYTVINLKNIKKYIKPCGFGVAVGLVNGVFGAGGGMLAVPLLQKSGLNQKSSHANAVAVILPITIISAILYLTKGTIDIKDCLLFLPTGLVGSVIATFALKNISSVWLKRLFGGFMIYAGVRLLLK